MKKAIAFTIKNSFLFFVIVLVLSVSSCDLFGEKEKEDPPGYLGSTLTISGAQVFNMYEQPAEGLNADVTKIVDQDHLYGASIADAVEVIQAGKITNGKFSIKLGTPKALTGFETSTLPSLPKEIIVSDPSAKFYQVVGFYIRVTGEDSDTSMTCAKFDTTNSTLSGASYMYADKDVTIKGTATSGTMTVTLDIELKAGWNTLLMEATTTSAIMKNGVPDDTHKWSTIVW